MDWDQRSITVFLAAAQLGSLGQVALKLNMSQPSVTRNLQGLEAALGVQLFERLPKGVRLTGFGEAFLPYATLINSEMETAQAMLALMRGAHHGLLRVGAVGSVASTYLARAVHRLLRDAPHLRVQILEEIEDRLAEALLNGEIDLAISPDPYPDERIALACEETLTDEVHVFAAPDHPLAQGGPWALRDTLGHNWALPPADTPVTREWRKRHLDAGLDVGAPLVSSRSINTIKSLTEMGDLLCWMPRHLMTHELVAGRVVAVDIPALLWPRRFHLYRRRMGHVPPSLKLMVAALQAFGAPRA